MNQEGKWALEFEERLAEDACRTTVIVEIHKEKWAPGFYAGCEGLELGDGYFVTAIDLENRKITIVSETK